MWTPVIGEIVGRWTVLSDPIKRKYEPVVLRCRCLCGNEREVLLAKLRRNSRSCGCARAEAFVQRNTTHGESGTRRTRLYRVWYAMIQRCTNPKHDNYQDYGGRGIFVCDAWRSYVTFREWAFANGYSPKLQIDRRNNNEGYSPENCRFVTEAVNKRNTRQTRLITAFGETKCLRDWTRDPRCQLTEAGLGHRIRKLKWNAERAIITPPYITKDQ